jgi:protein ImuB
MACVDLPAFPLQILLRRHPEWRGHPVAVIEEDRPQGLLLWVNEAARAARVLPGMRYAAAQALARGLRAGVVVPAEIEAEVEALHKRLLFFSPEVERARDEPGTFWLGAEGLGLLHPAFPEWAELIRTDLCQAGYEARVAVGFTRFGCSAAARAGPASVVCDGTRAGLAPLVFVDDTEERAAVRRIPIDRITSDADFRDTLARLGIFELGGFLDLPPAGIRRRFGEEAFALHAMARGEAWAPLDPEIPEEPHERRILLDHPETDTTRLLYAIEGDLQALLARLRARDRALAALRVEIAFDRAGPDGERRRVETLRPATPTRDLDLLLDLLRLRLEAIPFPSGVVDLRLEAEFAAAGPEQMALFPEQARRDLEAANRALARVRAEFGDGAVCTTRLVDAHLPEARFALEPAARLAAAEPRKVRTPSLVRRILSRPEPISLDPPRSRPITLASSRPAARAKPDGAFPTGMILRGTGIIAEAAGPFLVSGGWWRRAVERRYWYARVVPETEEAAAGAWHWIYFDARRRRWFRQGEVE